MTGAFFISMEELKYILNKKEEMLMSLRVWLPLNGNLDNQGLD